MPKTRRQYTGNAVSTTITGNLAAGGLSVAIAADTGWPTSGPFYAVIDPGTASEEKVYVSAKSTLTLTIVRGQDGTSDVQHSTGAIIYPVFTSVDADEANELASKYTTRGDIVYQGASTFERLAKGSQHHVLRAGANDPEYGLITNDNVSGSAAIALSKLATGALPTGITVASANIVNDSIVNEDIKSDAAIAHSKLANITAGQVLLGNASNVPTATALSGDVTVDSSGVTAIGGRKVTSSMLAATTVETKSANYTLALADAGKIIEGTAAITIAVPKDATVNFPVGSTITVTQTTSNQVTIGKVSGETLPNLRTSVGLKGRVQWSVITLYKRAADEWVVMGDTAP